MVEDTWEDGSAGTLPPPAPPAPHAAVEAETCGVTVELLMTARSCSLITVITPWNPRRLTDLQHVFKGKFHLKNGETLSAFRLSCV